MEADKTLAPINGDIYRRYFKHWRNGKTYDAHDYGHKYWPFHHRKK